MKEIGRGGRGGKDNDYQDIEDKIKRKEYGSG